MITTSTRTLNTRGIQIIPFLDQNIHLSVKRYVIALRYCACLIYKLLPHTATGSAKKAIFVNNVQLQLRLHGYFLIVSLVFVILIHDDP